jgi:hypothetical protein
MAYGYEKRVGFGATISWDSAGGSTFVVIGTVVDGDKNDAKWKTAKTSLLSEKADTFSKTSYDPGEFKFTIIYDPLDTEYQALKTAFLAVNEPAPQWELSFVDSGSESGSGSGDCSDTFFAHVVGLSREVKKEDFLTAEVTLKLTGTI